MSSGLLYELYKSIDIPDEIVDNVGSMRKVGEEISKKSLDLRINSQILAFISTISNNDLVLFKKSLETKKPNKVGGLRMKTTTCLCC